MKGIFVLLFVANAAIWGWFQFNKTSVSVVELVDLSVGNLEVVKQNSALKKKPAGSGMCISIGAFDNSSEIELAKIRLKSLDIDSLIIKKSKNIIKDYWVYLEPYENFQEAKKILTELNLKGLDSFIFSEGELRNGLSLGVYSNRDNASAIFTRVEGLGYNPRIKESFQDVDVYFLKLDKEGSSFYNASILDSLKERFPAIEQTEVGC